MAELLSAACMYVLPVVLIASCSLVLLEQNI